MSRDRQFHFNAAACRAACCAAPSFGVARRQLLGGLLAGGAALAMPAIARAQDVTPQPLPVVPAAQVPAVAGRRIVDMHHHFVPPEYRRIAHEQLVAMGALDFPPYAHWTPQNTLAEMDANNVATAILSISTPGVWFGNDAQAASLARICNEYAAALAADHPGRFGLFAALPMPDTDASLHEIVYALDRLHADGVGLMTSYGNQWLGDVRFAPVWEELNRRRAIAYVHPQDPACCNRLNDGLGAAMVDYPTDSTRTIFSLMYGGVFQKYPDIRWIFSQAGGTMPMVVGRIMNLGRAPAAAKLVPPAEIPGLLRRHHYEMANSGNRASVAAITSIVPMSQLLFGTDYPYIPTIATEAGLMQSGLQPADLQAIFRGNAEALMPRLAGV